MSQRRIKATLNEIQRNVGATGKFPRGHLNDTDEGELRFAVAVDPEKRTVMIVFGTPVSWMGLPPAQARELGETLIKNAAKIEALPPGGLPS